MGSIQRGNLAIDFTFLYIRGPWSVENRERNWRRRTLSRDRKLNYLSLTVPDEKEKKRGFGFWSLPDFLIHLIHIFSFSRSLRQVLLIRGQKMGCNSRLHLGFFASIFFIFCRGQSKLSEQSFTVTSFCKCLLPVRLWGTNTLSYFSK